VGQLFAGADRVKEWLLRVAQNVASTGHPISWVTPVGLPIVQPYRRSDRFMVPTVVQTVVIANHDDDLPVHRQRQRSAFPPNYVHSLDSTHMMLTALRIKEAGHTFAAVHDSYWTPAGTVDAMNAKLREAFVHMHEQPLLHDLRESLILRFPHIPFAPVPPLGDLDLQHVLRSTYFFN
jgi:DNA-directed RNA polymerase